MKKFLPIIILFSVMPFANALAVTFLIHKKDSAVDTRMHRKVAPYYIDQESKEKIEKYVCDLNDIESRERSNQGTDQAISLLANPRFFLGPYERSTVVEGEYHITGHSEVMSREVTNLTEQNHQTVDLTEFTRRYISHTNQKICYLLDWYNSLETYNPINWYRNPSIWPDASWDMSAKLEIEISEKTSEGTKIYTLPIFLKAVKNRVVHTSSERFSELRSCTIEGDALHDSMIDGLKKTLKIVKRMERAREASAQQQSGDNDEKKTQINELQVNELYD